MNVLIPTDFSDNSWNAIEYAISLLKEVRVTFHLLHINNRLGTEMGPEIQGSGTLLAAQDKIKVATQLQELKNKILTQYAFHNHAYKSTIENTSFIKGVRSQITKNEIDLIIMGTKGASGIKKYTLGSNAGDVITKVKCPVLVIPENTRFEEPKHIAFPTDFNLLYKERIVKTLKSVTQLHHSFLHVVHVRGKNLPLTEAQEKNKIFLKDSLEEIQHRFHTCNTFDLEEAIQKFVEKKQINIIAMVAKNLNFFQRILFRPTVKKMSYQTEVPFLVLHE
ncbi:universal stress protein [Marixanthomonas ophiurae]|uniref:Universal stress protein n=1 Tax=Marixanthomonas ophiurae TaxID=387659 RepID=A0A3E1QDP2_9FLAO|nr:universal stress protein [Marixanthomonas ophiurae]RFN60242.1 universal stress protein [Marixanthomonas ophiurae]